VASCGGRVGPQQAQARIEQDDDISTYISDRSREGSNVIRGNLQVLPVADSILYVQPLFLENPQAQIPELARVALVMGERTAFDRTLAGAVSQPIGVPVPDSIADEEAVDVDPGDVGDPQEPAPDTGGDDPVEASEELLVQALEVFARADDALRPGDLAAYQRHIATAQRLLESAAGAQGISINELVAPEDAAGGEEPSDSELVNQLDSGEDADATAEGTGTDTTTWMRSDRSVPPGERTAARRDTATSFRSSS